MKGGVACVQLSATCQKKEKVKNTIQKPFPLKEHKKRKRDNMLSSGVILCLCLLGMFFFIF